MSFPENFDIASVDFNAFYQGGQLLEGVDLPSIPWDIGAEQPVVVEAERAGRFHGAVLDAILRTPQRVEVTSRGRR